MNYQTRSEFSLDPNLKTVDATPRYEIDDKGTESYRTLRDVGDMDDIESENRYRIAIIWVPTSDPSVDAHIQGQVINLA